MRTMGLATIAGLLSAILVGLIVVFVVNRNPPSQLVVNADAVKQFELINTEGETVTPTNYAGHWTLLFFGFTRCPDVCPTTLIDMGQTLELLGPDAEKLQPVFISVDPEWDTRERMADYMKNFDPRIDGLTGSLDQVKNAAQNYSVFFRKVALEDGGYTIDHSAALYLLNPQGVYERPYSWQDGADVLAEKLRTAMDGA